MKSPYLLQYQKCEKCTYFMKIFVCLYKFCWSGLLWSPSPGPHSSCGPGCSPHSNQHYLPFWPTPRWWQRGSSSQQYIPLEQGCRMKSTGDTRACNNITQYSISGTDCPTLWILLRTPWSGGSYTRLLTLCWLDTTRAMEPSRPHPWPVRGSIMSMNW